jgi:hypothetical protein
VAGIEIEILALTLSPYIAVDCLESSRIGRRRFGRSASIYECGDDRNDRMDDNAYNDAGENLFGVNESEATAYIRRLALPLVSPCGLAIRPVSPAASELPVVLSPFLPISARPKA